MLLLPVGDMGTKGQPARPAALPRAMHMDDSDRRQSQAPVAQNNRAGTLLVSVYLVGFCVLVLALAVGTIHTRGDSYAVLQMEFAQVRCVLRP